MNRKLVLVSLGWALAVMLLFAARPAEAAGVVGNGTPGRCTEASLDAALVGVGLVTVNCGPSPHTIYQAQARNKSLRAHRDDVLRAIGQPGHLLVDARSAEMSSGADKAGTAQGGHIPGAVNLAVREETHPDGSFKAWRVPTVRENGTFKSATELRALVDGLGITPDKTIITYCVRGGLSTHAWFVLTQLLGYPSVREYDRSWAEWGNLSGVPVER